MAGDDPTLLPDPGPTVHHTGPAGADAGGVAVTGHLEQAAATTQVNMIFNGHTVTTGGPGAVGGVVRDRRAARGGRRAASTGAPVTGAPVTGAPATGSPVTATPAGGGGAAPPAGPGPITWRAWWGLEQTRQALLATAATLLVVLTVTAVVRATEDGDDTPGGGTGAPPALPAACASLAPAGSLSAVRADRDGHCYGYSDAVTGTGGFGDPRTYYVQHLVFEENANHAKASRAGKDLTVIWFGPLSGARSHESEKQQLQGLYLSQLRGDVGRVRVVVADAGENMSRAVEVAAMIASGRQAFGNRVVAVGGGDSRAVTRQAIKDLIAAGIPFIAPTLTGDLAEPGQPFLQEPGYLQLSPPNRALARAAVALIARYSRPGTPRRLVVYSIDDPADEYVTSLATDVQLEALRRPEIAPDPDYAQGVDQLDDSICRDSTDPAAVFFAARSTDFKGPVPASGAAATDFVNRVTALCRTKGGPALVVADDSVARFMTDDAERVQVPRATWPMAYFVKGAQCDALTNVADTVHQADLLLKQAGSRFGACVHGDPVKQIGESVSPTWDAVALAQDLLPAGSASPVGDPAYMLRLRTTKPFASTTGRLDVVDGQVVLEEMPADPLAPGPVRIYCVGSVTSGNRMVDACSEAFSGLRAPAGKRARPVPAASPGR